MDYLLSFSAAADRFVEACREWTDERHVLALTAIRHIAADLDNRRMSAALLAEQTKLMRLVLADRPAEMDGAAAEDALADFIAGLDR